MNAEDEQHYGDGEVEQQIGWDYWIRHNGPIGRGVWGDCEKRVRIFS